MNVKEIVLETVIAVAGTIFKLIERQGVGMMGYEKELEYLRKELKNSEAKFHEAEREGWHTDANIYKDNMENFEYQINIHQQAAKADECEAKLNEVKRQLKIKIRHARRDGDYSEASAFSEALDMIEYL